MAGRWLEPGLLAALALSLGANAAIGWTWHARRSAANAVTAASGEAVTTAMTEAWRRPFPGLGAGVNPVALDSCVVRGSWLADQLAALEEVRAKLVPAANRFEQAEVDAEQTAAFVAAFTAEVPAQQRRELQRAAPGMECRARWCRLTLPAGEKPPWLAQVVEQFKQSEWVGENLHEVEASKDTLLFERHPPGAVASSTLLQQALHEFESSGAVEACQAQHKQGQGTLDAEVTLAASDEGGRPDNGFTVEARGPLAGTSLGTCIDERFRQALAAIQLPPRYATSTALVQFPKP